MSTRSHGSEPKSAAPTGPIARAAGIGPAGTALLALAGALLGFAIVYVDYPFPKDAHPFTRSGPYFLWLLLLCGQVALWAALLPTLARALRKFAGEWAANTRMIAGVTAGFALLVILPVVVGERLRSTPDYPLPHHVVKVELITLLGVTAGLIGAAAVALVYAATGRALTRSGKVAAEELGNYFALRAVLLQLLAVEGAILSAAILATGALRHAVVSYTGREASFPQETLLAYGIYLSAVVALLYGPVYNHLQDLGRSLRDRIIDNETPATTFVEKLEHRQKLGELLGLDLSATSSFRSVLLVLTPLSTSLISLLVGKT